MTARWMRLRAGQVRRNSVTLTIIVLFYLPPVVYAAVMLARLIQPRRSGRAVGGPRTACGPNDPARHPVPPPLGGGRQ